MEDFEDMYDFEDSIGPFNHKKITDLNLSEEDKYSYSSYFKNELGQIQERTELFVKYLDEALLLIFQNNKLSQTNEVYSELYNKLNELDQKVYDLSKNNEDIYHFWMHYYTPLYEYFLSLSDKLDWDYKILSQFHDKIFNTISSGNQVKYVIPNQKNLSIALYHIYQGIELTVGDCSEIAKNNNIVNTDRLYYDYYKELKDQECRINYRGVYKCIMKLLPTLNKTGKLMANEDLVKINARRASKRLN